MWIMVYTICSYVTCCNNKQCCIPVMWHRHTHTLLSIKVCMLHLASAWLRDQNKAMLCSYNMSNVRNHLAGLHILPRIKISWFCYLGKHFKQRMGTSMLKGTHWRTHNVCQKGSRLAARQWGMLWGHISERLSFPCGFLYSLSHFMLFTQA